MSWSVIYWGIEDLWQFNFCKVYYVLYWDYLNHLRLPHIVCGNFDVKSSHTNYLWFNYLCKKSSYVLPVVFFFNITIWQVKSHWRKGDNQWITATFSKRQSYQNAMLCKNPLLGMCPGSYYSMSRGEWRVPTPRKCASLMHGAYSCFLAIQYLMSYHLT